MFRGDFQRNNQEKVRKKLRSTAQLLAHLAAGLAAPGLQRIYPLKYYDQLRNFLRSWGFAGTEGVASRAGNFGVPESVSAPRNFQWRDRRSTM
jgi:hypothetical protein